MIVPRDGKDLILFVYLKDTAHVPITGKTYDTVAIQELRAGQNNYSTLTLTEGTLGVYEANTWIEVNQGTYQFCPSNDLIIPGTATSLLLSIADHPTFADSLNAVGDIGGTDIVVVVPTSTIEQANLPDDTSLVYRGTQWNLQLDGIKDLKAASHLYFGVKDGDVPDDESLIQVKWDIDAATGQVLYLNKQPSTSTDVTIVHSTYVENDETLHRFNCSIKGEVTADVPPSEVVETNPLYPGIIDLVEQKRYFAGWKLVGDEDFIVRHGFLVVRPDVNRATS